MKNEGVVQFVKFGVVGGINTGVDWVVFFLISSYLITAKEQEPSVKAIAFLVAMLNSFIWNSAWTFKKEYKKAVNKKSSSGLAIFGKFALISILGWIINYYAFKYTRFSMDQGKLVALIAASAAATLWNFFGNKLWTYKK